MLLMIAYLFIGTGPNTLSLTGKITLDTKESIRGDMDRILLNSKGTIFIFSYWNSKILMFDSSGRYLKTIANSGEGPGEIRRPKYIFALDESKMLVIEADPPKAHVFDFLTGKYLKLIRGLPGSNMWAYNGLGFVALRNGRFATELWEIYDRDLAIKTKFGKQEPNPVFQFYSRRYALAFDKSGTIFYQEGYMPSVHVYDKKFQGFKEWRLKPPEHFKKFEKPMDTRISGFSREKSHLHMKSFTHLNRLFILDERIMMVEWLIWEPSLKSLDFYDLKTKKLLLSNFRTDAETLATLGLDVFALKTPTDEKPDEKSILYKYRFKE